MTIPAQGVLSVATEEFKCRQENMRSPDLCLQSLKVSRFTGLLVKLLTVKKLMLDRQTKEMTAGAETAETMRRVKKYIGRCCQPRTLWMNVECPIRDEKSCFFLLSEINKVRVSLFHLTSSKEPFVLPTGEGQVLTLSEKVFVPVKDHPDVSILF